jgi:hypothetical protein
VKIEELEPRALDALAAEKLLQYTWRLSRSGTCRFLAPPVLPPPDDDLNDGETYPPAKGDEPLCKDALRLVPKLSEDIAAAWQVLMTMMFGPKTYEFAAAIWDDRGENTLPYITVHATLMRLSPRSICIAALKALGVEEVPDNA